MWTDPIVQEIRAGRDAHAAALGYDAERLYQEIKQHEQLAKQQGVQFISLQPRPVRPLPVQTAASAV